MSFYTFTALTALAGAVASMIVGFVWYGPLFGKKWGKVMDMKMPENLTKSEMMAMQKQMIPHYALNFVVSFVQYYALGFFAALIGGLTISGALLYAVFVWVGFTMPIQAGAAIWSGKSKKDSWTMFGLTAGYQLIALLIGSVIWALLYSTLG